MKISQNEQNKITPIIEKGTKAWLLQNLIKKERNLLKF